MDKRLFHQLIVILFLCQFHHTVGIAQGIHYNIGNTILTEDSITIVLSGYRDSVRWERSGDLTVWEEIQGTVGNVLEFKADQNEYIRAVVLEGTCDPVITDTVHLDVVDLNNDIILIDRLGSPTISNSAELSTGIYRYDFEYNGQVNEGSTILISKRDRGYIRRIHSISTSLGQTTFITSQASLADVIQEGMISDSVRLFLSRYPEILPGQKVVPLASSILIDEAQFTGSGSGILIKELKLYDGEVYGGELIAILKDASLEFDPIIHRHLSINSEDSGLQEFIFSLQGDLRYIGDVEVFSTVPVNNFSRERELGRFLYGPITCGPVPMYLELLFTLGIELTSNVPGTAQSGIEESSRILVGAAYDSGKNPPWSIIHSSANNYSDHQVIWEKKGDMDCRTYIRVKASALIAGKEGPSLEFESRQDYSAEVDHNTNTWEWSLNAGMKGTVEVLPSILDKDIPEFLTQVPESSKTVAFGYGTIPVPMLTTAVVKNIGITSATSGGEITSDGGSAIIQKGVCWGLTEYPTISDELTDDGSGTITFESQITGLDTFTTYYVRAYAINATGVGYGDQVSFTTNDWLPSPPPPPPPPPGGNDEPPTVTTNTVTNITTTSAICGGNVTDDGGPTVVARGVCWDTSQYPDLSDPHTHNGTGEGVFVSNLIGLTSGTTYYVRAYATNSEGTSYGAEEVFETDVPPAEGEIFVISPQSGDNWNVGTSYTISWNDNISEEVKIDLYIAGTFLSMISSSTASDGSYFWTLPTYLSTSDNYRIRITSILDNSIYDYSDYFTITSESESCEDSYEPNDGIGNSNTTAFPTSLGSSAYSKSISGTLHEAGDWDHYRVNVTSAGVLDLSLTNIPDGFDLQLYDYNFNYVKGSFTKGSEYISRTITNVGYYYVIVGSMVDEYSCTPYNLEVSWTPTTIPSCEDIYEPNESIGSSNTSAFPTALGTSAYSKTISGTVHEAGDWDQFRVNVTSAGVLDLSLTNIPDGFDLQLYDFNFDYVKGSFTMGSEYISMTISDIGYYYIKVGSVENAYSCTPYYLALTWTPSGISVTTPTVSTGLVNNIGYYEAYSGGYISDDGGATVTVRGVCWSTSSSPTTADDHTTDGSGSGSFTSYMTGLSAGTAYFVRAYATNSAGTSYGSVREFTTLTVVEPPPPPPPPPIGGDEIPTVTTKVVSDISFTTATSGGNVTSDGGATVTTRGVCWSIDPNPTLTDSYTENGSGTGDFTSYLNDLDWGTVYYIRAYAINSVGIAYGEELTFETNWYLPPPPPPPPPGK